MRVLKGRPISLTHSFLNDDEDVLPLTGVTVTLKDSDGVTVASSDAVEGVPGVWSVTLPMQPLGPYTAVWDGTTAIDETHIEVVGGFLFSITEARNSDDDLLDTNVFPAAEIRYYRDVVESEFEQITGRSFTTRVVEKSFTADCSPSLIALVPDAQAVESVTVNGVAVADVSGYRVSKLGAITAPASFADGDSVTVRIRYGFTTPPAQVARVAMIRLRNLLASENSGIPDRATSWQPEEGGTFRLATPGVGKSRTGIPEVDSTLSDYTLDAVLAVFSFV